MEYLKVKTLVCLPTRNERESIARMVKEILALGYDLVVVDSESTDGTIEIAEGLRIPVYQRDGRGKGWGVRKAIDVTVARGKDTLVLIDCDCSYPPSSIPEIVKPLSNCEMVVGKRPMRAISPSHRMVNRLHTLFLNILFSTNLHDINSGLRAFKVGKLKGMLTSRGFDIEAELTAKAVKKGMKILEIPISYEKREGKSKIKPWDTFIILWRILREKLTE